MATSREDFAKIGLSAADWKAFILGKGTIDPRKLGAARAAVARLGRYSPKQAADPEFTDAALRALGTQYPHLSIGDEPMTHDDKVRFLQVRDNCSREEAERHLERVRKDKEEVARIFGKTNA